MLLFDYYPICDILIIEGCFFFLWGFLMILGEIQKTDNIIISFEIGTKHFDFTTALLPKVDKEHPDHVIYSDPILIQGSCLKIDNNKCQNQSLKYFNQRSGRTHIWKNPEIEYRSKPRGHYHIKCEAESILENRRRALRVPINSRSSCTMSDLEGKYPCTVCDVSVTGVGINIDIALAEKNPLHRLVYTQFKDEITECVFYITARVLHSTPLDRKTSRCGCEIINVSPSINEYINLKQMHKLAKANLYEEISGMTVADVREPDKEGVLGVTDIRPELSDSFKRNHPIAFLSPGDPCPICERGHVMFKEGVFVCTACESIIDP